MRVYRTLIYICHVSFSFNKNQPYAAVTPVIIIIINTRGYTSVVVIYWANEHNLKSFEVFARAQIVVVRYESFVDLISTLVLFYICMQHVVPTCTD